MAIPWPGFSPCAQVSRSSGLTPYFRGENIDRPCVCGGSNENCAFCYGTGVMNRDLSGTKRSSQPRNSRRPSPKPPILEPKCDRCAFRGTPKDLRKHWQQEHLTFDERLEAARQELAKKQPRPNPRRQPIYRRPDGLRACEYCGAKLLPLLLKHHKKREHRNRQRTPVKPANLPNATGKRP
jgi:hypothetical protein